MHIVQMLNILENYALDEMGYGSADAVHVDGETYCLPEAI